MLMKVPKRGSLVTGTMSQWLSMCTSIILGILITPIIIRTLGKESYGLWGMVAGFAGFYGVLDFGLNAAVSRFLGNAMGARDLKQFNQVVSTGTFLLWSISFLIIIVAILMIEPAKSILRIPDVYARQFDCLIVLSGLTVAVYTATSTYGIWV